MHSSPPATNEHKTRPIREPNLLLTEGRDACFFCEHALKAYGLNGFQVFNFGGNSELAKGIETVRVTPGFEQTAKTIVIIRDAENSASAAVASVQGALKKVGFSVPNKPFEIADGNPRTAFILFPGLNELGKLIPEGRLEDLCLATVENQPMLDCVDKFLSCCEGVDADMRRQHKMRLHAYLAGHDKFVGMKIGEAAQAGAWDWNHSIMKPFRELLCAL